MKIDHVPVPKMTPLGRVCARCDAPLHLHRRPKHHSKGDPCEECGLALNRHLPPNISGEKPDPPFIGVDGEGIGRRDHRYVLLAASDKAGRHACSIEHKDRLRTEECLEFFLALPEKSRLVSYSFGYDLTKILTDLPNPILYRLMRPELRKRPLGSTARLPFPVQWKDYELNLIGTRFTVAKKSDKRTVWDLFKFYQSKFVTALRDWKVGDAQALERIGKMKDERAAFSRLTDEIRAYCLEECALLSELADKLVAAHKAVDLKLTNFYGAGSTAGAILKKLEIKSHQKEAPQPMRKAVAQAFFGGRFENAVVGAIKGEVWSYDISSAYPYELRFLPCLSCGHWKKTKNRSEMKRADAALVRYELWDAPSTLAWGPFPYRMRDGTIVFAKESAGGWVYRDEFLWGEKVAPHVRFVQAWVYKTPCDHVPFAQIPVYYKERLRIGKEGAGIILKLGPNSCYGKLAQSIGDPPFQSWIWAGMITSGTRAKILEMIALHKDPKNLLSVATDGICTRERLIPSKPKETGTSDCVDPQGNPVHKPLGGWEEKLYPKGLFFARPGIYFRLNPTAEDIANLRARGIGRAALLAHWQEIVTSYEEGIDEVKMPGLPRFFGAKTCISLSLDKKTKEPKFKRKELYGQWKKQPTLLSLRPLPKRDGVTRHQGYSTLGLRSFPLSGDESAPYEPAIQSEEALRLKEETARQWEQPDPPS